MNAFDDALAAKLAIFVSRRLNDHCFKHMAGFYMSTGHRAFGARVKAGQLQVTLGGDEWINADPHGTYSDHNGRTIDVLPR